MIAKQDKTLETLSARVLAVEHGAVEDLEPKFREFCERAKTNPFGGPARWILYYGENFGDFRFWRYRNDGGGNFPSYFPL